MARERFVAIDGLNTRYLEAGAGTPVLLLHGASLGSSADVWAETTEALAARGLRAIAVDLPGFGLTDNPRDHSVGFRMRFAPMIMDALALERPHVVGHSQSGRIVVKLALDTPQTIGSAIVAGTASLLPPTGSAKGGDGEGDEGSATEPTREETKRSLEAMVFNRDVITPQRIDTRQRMSIGKNFEAFVARRAAKAQEKAKSSESQPMWQRLAEARAPLRLLYGRQDRDASERVRLARERNPRLDVHLIDSCGHLIMWDAQDELVSRVAELARLDSVTSP